jgi:hypothetical protein
MTLSPQTSAAIAVSIFANVDDVVWLERFTSSAALCIEELQKFLERIRVGRVAQESALPAHFNKAFILELIQMMGER